MTGSCYDAVVVGAGPNGLAAAICIAQSGRQVALFEAKETIGGGTRTAELTLPGFRHDICSSVHPLGVASPFFRTLPLAQYGLDWVFPPTSLAHPFDDGTAALLRRSVRETAETLGPDARAYRLLIGPLAANWSRLVGQIWGPAQLPRHPFAFARFGLPSLLPVSTLAGAAFRGKWARGLFAGMAAHSMLQLDTPGTSGFALGLAMSGHAVGWPFARRGSQSIADALGRYLENLGGQIETGRRIESLSELPRAKVRLFDLTPRQLLGIAGDELPAGYRSTLSHYRYGPGVFKLDLALDGPVPWQAAGCAQAGTVHLGPTLEEIMASEQAVWEGRHPERPFVLVAQASRFDCSRAPEGKHTVWAYCHVPAGSTADMSEAIETQIERFAPGFRNRILARQKLTAAEMEQYNANYIGGDINGGVQDLLQFYTRPAPRLDPYSTPNKSIYICSSSTPPGGGVHGMCGYYAARSALHQLG